MAKQESIFKKLFNDLPDGRTKRWFKKTSEQIADVPESQVVTKLPGKRLLPTAREAVIGNFWLFQYNPKTRKELPYYDKLPHVLIISLTRDSFLGLNFHYLPMDHRLRLYEKLKVLRNTKNLLPQTRIRITYQILLENMAKYKEYLPCIKRYLFKHVTSNFIHVPPRDWDFAVLLPFYRFKKKAVNYVWMDSIAIMRRSLDGGVNNK